MSTLRKIRLALLLVFGVPSLMCVGGVAVWNTLFGVVEVHVLGPATVTVDGATSHSTTEYQALSFEVDQGQHTLQIVTESGASEVSKDFDSAWDEWLLPSPGQCFIQLDVTETFYAYGTPEDPLIEARHGDGALIELPTEWAFFEDDLPYEVNEHAEVYMFIDVDCPMLQRSDAELLADFGF